MADPRQQLRRDADERERLRESIHACGRQGYLQPWFVERFDALLAELKQAELERDEAIEGRKDDLLRQREASEDARLKAEARLASVPALVEAGNRIVTAQFGTDGKLVFKQTPETVDALHALRDALTVYEQSQGNG